MFRRFLPLLLCLALPGGLAAAPAGAEALLVVMGDQHSAYERTAQLVALVDGLKAENPELPLAVLLNGDALEQGNALARRSAGEVDFAMLAALAKRAPTVLNLGNHEPEFYDLAETVRRIEATGARVVGSIRDRATGQPFAGASTSLQLGKDELIVVGVTTDSLSTYRAAVRPSLDLAEPVAWAKANWPQLWAREPPPPATAPPAQAQPPESPSPVASTEPAKPAAETEPTPRPSPRQPLPVVLSHCGMAADRELLKLVPEGTLFAGAHNHLRFVEPMGRTVYVHSGSWNEYATLAWRCRDTDGTAHWEIEQVPVPRDGAADPELAALIRTVGEKYADPADAAVIGRAPQAMTQAEAAQFLARLVADATEADAVFIGNTTFGAGLPAGDVTQAEFDACMRFENALATAEVDGARLKQLLAAANQGPDTPFAERRGEFNYAAGPEPEKIRPGRLYRIATTDWGARNGARYFGEPVITWREHPELKVKALMRARLAAAPLAGGEARAGMGDVSLEDLYESGKALFEAFAPDEVKEAYEFPSKEQWDLFAARLQQALEGDRLEDLAQFEPEARAALEALRVLPGYEDYADWLEERIDYVEAAKQTVRAPAPAPQPTPPPKPDAPQPPAPAAPAIPHYELWVKRVQARPVPANAGKLMPGLRYIFAAEGVPAELAWLAEAESTLNPAARSPAGARGLFQLMPATAKELGLSTWLPDERTHPEKSARAAAQLLKKLRGQFGDWPLALAAYNAGAGRVRRTLDKNKAKTFAEIADALPNETRMYVPKVLATLQVRSGVTPEKLR